MKNAQYNIEKLQDFVDQKSNAKSHIQKCIKFLTTRSRYINCRQRQRLTRFIQSSTPVHKLIFQVLQFTGLRMSA